MSEYSKYECLQIKKIAIIASINSATPYVESHRKSAGTWWNPFLWNKKNPLQLCFTPPLTVVKNRSSTTAKFSKLGSTFSTSDIHGTRSCSNGNTEERECVCEPWKLVNQIMWVTVINETQTEGFLFTLVSSKVFFFGKTVRIYVFSPFWNLKKWEFALYLQYPLRELI